MATMLSKLTAEETTQLKALGVERLYADGARIIEEGEISNWIGVVLSGKVFVLKSNNTETHKLSEIGEGDTIGEIGLFEDNPERSATIIADGNTTVLRIDLDKLKAHSNLFNKVSAAAGQNLIQRIKNTNAKVMAATQKQLKVVQHKNMFGAMLLFVIFATTIYIFGMSFVDNQLQLAKETRLISIGIMFTLSLITFNAITKSRIPLSKFGFDSKNTREDFGVGLKFGLGAMIGLTLFKWLAMKTGWIDAQALFLYSGLIDANVDFALGSLIFNLIVLILLSMSVEVVFRCCLQACMMEFLEKHEFGDLYAITMASLIFATARLHLGQTPAITTLALGIFYGLVFNHRRSLVTVTTTHVITVAYAVFGLGLSSFFH